MTGRLFSSRGRRRDRDERERGFLEGERDPEESKGLFVRNFGSVKEWGGGRHAGQRAETELLEICQPTDGNGPDIHTRSFRSEQGRRAVDRRRVREKKPRRRKRRGYYRAASSSPRCSFTPSFPPPLVPAEQS